MERDDAELVWGWGKEIMRREGRGGGGQWHPQRVESRDMAGRAAGESALVASFQELTSRSQLSVLVSSDSALAHGVKAREEEVSGSQPGALLLGSVRLGRWLPWLPTRALGVSPSLRPACAGPEGQARPGCQNGDRAPAVLLSNSVTFPKESHTCHSCFPQL